MDLFRDIKRGKKFSPKELKRESRHELKELGGEKKAEKFEKKVKEARSKALKNKKVCI